MRITAAYLLLAMMLSGCSWLSGMFGDDEETNQPAELQSIKQEVTLAPAWNHRIGDSAEDKTSQLLPVVVSGRVFAASADGNVLAMEEGSGRVVWEVNIKQFYTEAERRVAFADKSDVITGGVGGGPDLVLVGSFAGEIVAMNQSDGSLAWRAKTTSEVLAPPQVRGDLVVAQSIDGKVAAFDALDGTRSWIYSASNPSLSLRGTSTPIVTDEFVIAGFANGRIVVLDPGRGVAGLDRRVGLAQGKSDLERLVDVDGRMVLVGSQLFAVSYQGSLVGFDLANGRPMWEAEASSSVGLGQGFGNIYIAYANGTVAAVDVSNGRNLWENDSLAYRELTTPVAISSYIAVGDLEGYLHLIAQSDGRFVGRRRVANDPLKSPAVVSGSRIFIQTVNGRLMAYDLQ